MMEISCSNCGRAYPPDGLPYRCPTCGGLYDFHTPLPFDPALVDWSQPGIWRYRHTFGLSPDSEPVSLGEGSTPLLWAEVFGRKVAFKCEFLNPSGSFKDRGSAVITAWLQSRGINDAVEDSSGNAGASFAAYAARAGIKARVFVPESASGPKRRQIEAYGAELVPVPGSRTDVSEAARAVADGGTVYASHAYLPFNLPGYATAAYEIFEQLGKKMPGSVVLPAGQGGLLLGLVCGFDAMRIAIHSSNNTPRIIGVQARACAPLWAMFKAGSAEAGLVAENRTLAEGVRVRYPLRRDAVLQAVVASHGSMCVADENEILPGRDALARIGFYVEPTSAIVWSALAQTIRDLPDPVVVVLTGSGYKYE
ncbi:MAG: pyridoxal-phosphate dependent enzyme [Chloroflexi bacterium]|nr:pyridoxal-phosphate dependent enzyme [Chloroflexota bacterium]